MVAAMEAQDLSKIQRRIVYLAKKSRVGKRVKGVTVEAGEGEDFLTVVIELEDIERVKVEEVEPLVRSIEDAVGRMDARYPSVRFADAA